MEKNSIHTSWLCSVVTFCSATGQETLHIHYLLQKQKNQIERVMILFLSLSQDRTFLLKIDSMLFDEGHFSNVTKPNLFLLLVLSCFFVCLGFLVFYFFLQQSEGEYMHLYKKDFLLWKGGFWFTDSKMFKPGRIIMIIQSVLLNIHATEFLSEAGLKQTFWKIFNLVLNIQVIWIPSVSLIPYWTVWMFNYPCS